MPSYRFNLVTGQTTEHALDDANIEFPSVDSRIMGRRPGPLGLGGTLRRPRRLDRRDRWLPRQLRQRRAEGRVEINVFDASDVAAGPLARVLLPVRVPSGFHATWVRADQLQSRA